MMSPQKYIPFGKFLFCYILSVYV